MYGLGENCAYDKFARLGYGGWICCLGSVELCFFPMESASTDKEKFLHIWWFVLPLCLTVLFLGRNIKTIRQSFIDLEVSWRLRPYERRIKICLQENEKTLDEKKVIGIEYECAIRAASSFYEQDRELAIELCSRHRFFDAGNSVMRPACISSIEQQVALSKIITPATLVGLDGQHASSAGIVRIPSEAQGTLFENMKYGYSFRYPIGSRVSNFDDSVKDIAVSRYVSVFDKQGQLLFSITALDPEPLRAHFEFQKTIERYGWSVPDYAAFIERKNFFQNSSGKGNLVATSTEMIDGQKAFELWFEGLFNDGDAVRMLEPDRQIFSFVKPAQRILQISYPSNLDQESENIYQSLRWLP